MYWFVLAHGFKGFSLWSLGFIAFGSKHGEVEHHGGSMWWSKVAHQMVDRRKRKSETETERPREDKELRTFKHMSPVTYYQQLGLTCYLLTCQWTSSLKRFVSF
jgi:hypothetical protein